MQSAPPLAWYTRPWEVGMGVCGSSQGQGLPLVGGDPFVPLAHAGALDIEGEREGRACCPPPGSPGVPRSPDPRAPSGVPLRTHLTPKLSAATQLLQTGNGGPEEGKAGALTLSPGASLGPHPPAPPAPAKSCSWNRPGNQHRRGKEAALWAGGALGVAPASSLPSP